MFYFLKFAKFAPMKAPTLPGSIRQHVNAILSVFAATIGLIYMSPFKDPAAIIGQAAVVFCIAMFGSPLAALKTVLETKSAKSIPLPFTLATVANCFLWSISGLFEMNDKNIYFRTYCREKGREGLCVAAHHFHSRHLSQPILLDFRLVWLKLPSNLFLETESPMARLILNSQCKLLVNENEATLKEDHLFFE
jgi:uncharacterized protein with PQ loop repeat